MNIIISADDFGISRETDNTIINCHQNGILTSTSILANGRNFFEAVELYKENPNLGIGAHLTLEGQNNFTKPPSSIIDPETEKFYGGKKILRKLQLFRINQKDLIDEYSKQAEFVLDHGIKINHLDHHHHFHLYKPALDAMIWVAKKYKINFIRSQRLILSGEKNLAKLLYREVHQFYLRRKICTLDGYFSFLGDDLDTMKARLQLLIGRNYENVEIVMHPQKIDDPNALFLLSKDTKKLLKTCNLINYKNLAKQKGD